MNTTDRGFILPILVILIAGFLLWFIGVFPTAYHAVTGNTPPAKPVQINQTQGVKLQW